MSIFGEKFTLSQKVFLSTFLNQVALFGIQFLSSIFIVQAIPIHEYGLYILFNTTLNLAGNLTNLGLRSYLTRFVPGSSLEKGQRILWSVLWGQAIAAVLLVLVGVPIYLHYRSDLFSKFPADNQIILIALFSILLFTSFAPKQFAGYYRYHDLGHSMANRLQLICGASYPILILLSVFILKSFNVTFALSAMVVSQLFNTFAVYFIGRKVVRLQPAVAIVREMGSAFSYSWPFAFLPIATQLIEVGNRYFLAGYKTPLELAAFSFNYGICSAAFTLISTSLGLTFFPMAIALFNKGEIARGKNLNFKGVMLSSFLIVLFFISYNFLNHYFLRFLGRESLALGTLPLLFISLSFLLQSLMQHPGFLMQVYNVRFSNVGITLSGTVLSIVLNFWLIRKYSILGAALALCATSAYLLIMNILPVLKFSRGTPPQ